MPKSLYAKFSLNQTGDTIVEVVICIAVIGLALSTGYGLTNRSFKYGLASAERSQAQALAQGQTEFIKSYALDGNVSKYTAMTEDFCIYDGNIQNPNITLIGNPVTDPTLCQGFDGSIFNIAVNYDSTSRVFKVTATWDGTTSANQNQTTLYYKLGT